MQFVIDGYNLLFRLDVKAKNLEEARQKTLVFLNEIATRTKWSLLVIFDGKREQGLGFSRKVYQLLEVIYTADGVSADEFILEMIQRSQNPKLLHVVTSDKRLADEVRRQRAESLGIYQFLDKSETKEESFQEKSEEDPPWYRTRLEKAFEKRLREEKKREEDE